MPRLARDICRELLGRIANLTVRVNALKKTIGAMVIAAELFGGLALILGAYTCWISLALVPILLGSIYVPHGVAGFFFSNEGGGWEFPAFWAVALVQALLGDGAFALKRDRA